MHCRCKLGYDCDAVLYAWRWYNTAQAILANLLANATTTTLNGLLALKSTSHCQITFPPISCSGTLSLVTQLKEILSPNKLTGDIMTKRARQQFSAEFKLESAQLVLDQNYSVAEAAQAMNVDKSTMNKWGRQLREERQGKSPKASPMTPEQIEIRELKKKLALLEEHNEILKKPRLF